MKNKNKNKDKYKEIVVCGCIMRVLASKAKELEKTERILIQEHWAKNRVD